MSDTIACSNCGTEVPPAAAFCTGCGQPLQAAAASAPPPPPSDDATRVETPGLNDATQVTPPPPSAPPASFAPPAPRPPSTPGAPGAPSGPGGPWGPSTTTPPTGPPTSAPWNPPTSPPPPSYQPPTAPPPGAATFPPPTAAAGGPPTWGDANAPAAGSAPWGQTEPAAPAARTSPSILGGLVGLVGAVLTIVGVFSGWVKLGDTGTVTAWSLTAGEDLLKSQTPYVIVALAGVAGLSALLLFTGIARTVVRIVAALTGIAIVGVTAANWAEIASFVTDNFPSSFEATTAIGFYLAIAGGVLVFVSALLPGKKKG
ncbi:zinc ribbon domain-containing protein [Aquihabitans daechungensis]|uniref:zinc ribbon domain-containing protein n=1 Tax=Aquihabitans daechungensis TaxID=1052257 RepID=UPI003BA1F17C